MSKYNRSIFPFFIIEELRERCKNIQEEWVKKEIRYTEEDGVKTDMTVTYTPKRENIKLELTSC